MTQALNTNTKSGMAAKLEAYAADHQDLPETVRVLVESEIPYRWVQLEVAFGRVMDDPAVACRALSELADLFGYTATEIEEVVSEPEAHKGMALVLTAQAAIFRELCGALARAHDLDGPHELNAEWALTH